MKRLRKLNIIIGDEDAIINVDNVVDKGGKITKRNFDYLPVSSRRMKSVFFVSCLFANIVSIHFFCSSNAIMEQIAETSFCRCCIL